ncbi:aromatic aminobenezylarsenical efflux permease ArsG family transporter [Chloroflexota bacterium]
MDLAGWLRELASGVNIPVLSALLLGLVTALSPCPMATNIAAIAYVSRQVASRKHAVISGSLYTAGRMFAYSLLGFLIIVVGLEIPGVARFLQDFGGKIFGPLLIVIGLSMIIIDRFSINLGGNRLSRLGDRLAKRGMLGSFLLGALFALAFCPISALIFFGILIPLALGTSGGAVLPAVYAIGTGLPVLVFGVLISAGVAGVAGWLNAISRAEKVIRIIVSLLFISVGVYYIVLWIQS